MLFKVEMQVHPPRHLELAAFDSLKATEKAYSQQLQHIGVWRHLWRIAGQYKNVSIFDVTDIDHLHKVLTGLPLFPYMTLEVTPLCRHPSAIYDDDR